MLIHGKAVIEIAHYQRVDQLEFGKKDCEEAKSMHGPQRFRGMRLNQNGIEISPGMRPRRRRVRKAWQYMLDSAFRGNGRLQAVVGGKAEDLKQQLGIADGRRLLQVDEPINDRKIRVRKP